MASFKLPTATSKPGKLADWIELKALASADGNASIQDLVAVLRRDASIDILNQGELLDCRGESSELLAIDAFSEIDNRKVAAGPGYPFQVDDQHIQLRGSSEAGVSTYIFQLLLSYFGVRAGKGSNVRPERDFEDISFHAAQSYFGRNDKDGSYLFAFPRRTNEKSFASAIDKLSALLGEGGGAKGVPPVKNQKDARLDIVVWHGFADRKPGQVIAFGQCAAGDHWRSKVNDLPDGGRWCQAWMRQPPAVPPLRMFFIPHSLSEEEWETSAILGGVLFERCRIAYHAPRLPGVVSARSARWVRKVLENRGIGGMFSKWEART